MRRRLGTASHDPDVETSDPCGVEGCAAHTGEGLPVCGAHWASLCQGEQVAFLEAIGSLLSARDPVEKGRKARARVVTILRGVCA